MIERFSPDRKELLQNVFSAAPMTNGLDGWISFNDLLKIPDTICFGDISKGNESCFLFQKKDENLYLLHGIAMFDELNFVNTFAYAKVFTETFGTENRVYALAEHVWTRILLAKTGFVKADEIRQLEARRLDVPDIDNGFVIKTDALFSDLSAAESAFPPLWRLCREELEGAVKDSDCILTAYAPNGEIAGSLLAAIEPEGKCDLMRLAVLPQYRGQGIAKALIREMVLHAERMHANLYCVNTNLRNTGAISLYHKIGFNEIVRINPIYRSNFRWAFSL